MTQTLVNKFKSCNGRIDALMNEERNVLRACAVKENLADGALGSTMREYHGIDSEEKPAVKEGGPHGYTTYEAVVDVRSRYSGGVEQCPGGT